jgi:hypothetical protein
METEWAKQAVWTLWRAQEFDSSHGNPPQGVQIVTAFINKPTAKFFLSSFNTRLNRLAGYNTVAW